MAPPALAPPAASTGGVKLIKALNAKHYIMSALTATLATAVVITVAFVVLSPARLYFSVTYASASRQSPGDSGLQLNLTLAANNTSRRARVEYDSMFVDVSNSTGPGWMNWVSADVAAGLPLRQPTRSETHINATVSLVGGPLVMAFTGNMTSTFRVMVTTLAKFKVGFASTRPYDIKLICGPLSLFPMGAGGLLIPPVKCG